MSFIINTIVPYYTYFNINTIKTYFTLQSVLSGLIFVASLYDY